MHYQNLTVDTTARTYTDNRNGEFGSDAFGKFCRYFFEYEGETSYFLEQMCVGEQFFGFAFFFRTNGVCAEFIDGLRREAQMTHHGNAGAEYSLYGFADFGAALHLYGFCMALLHYAYGGGKGFFRIALIGAERHVAYNEGAFSAFDHAFGVIYHLVEGDRESGDVAGHDVRGRVAYQNHVHSGFVDEFCHRVVVGREHGDFLAALFHFDKARSGDFALIVYSIG